MGDQTPRSRRRTFLKSVGVAGIAGLAGCSSGDGSSDGGDGSDGSDGGDGSDGSDGGDGGDGGDGTTTGSGQTGGEIVIGNAAPTSGSFSPWGRTHRRGLEFAVNEINENGGVLDGRELSVVTQDTEANPQTATTVFERLVNNEDAVAVTGPVSSDVGIATRDVAEDTEVPLLPNQAATASLLTRDTRYVFRVGGTATPTYVLGEQGTIEEEGYTEYAAIYADYAFGQSYIEAVERFIVGMEGLNTNIQAAPPTVDDVQTYLRQVPDGVEFLDLGGHPIELFTFIQQAAELGMDPDIITGPNIPTSVMANALDDLLFEGPALFSTVDPAADNYQEVAGRFAEAQDSVFEQYHAYGYETGRLVAAAIEEAGSADPTAIRDAMSGIEMDTILAYPQISYTDWGELEQAKVHGLTFVDEAPAYYSDGSYTVESFYESEIYDPVDPDEWG